MGMWSCLRAVYRFTFSLGIFFLAQPSQIIGYLGQISSCAWKQVSVSFNSTHRAAAMCLHRQRQAKRLKFKLTISNLDVFKVKWLLAVLAVECSLRALSLVMALLFVEANSFFTRRAGDEHELALPLVVQLYKKQSLSWVFVAVFITVYQHLWGAASLNGVYKAGWN